MKKNLLFNFPIDTGRYQYFINRITDAAISGQGKSVYVANVHMVIEAFRSKSFLEKVQKAWMVLPDGKPLTWALRLLYGIRQDRVAGMDILPALLVRSQELSLPVYFYGGTSSMLNTTNDYLKAHYPSLKISGLYSPPFRELTIEEKSTIIEKINKSGASILFVVLGCPKQELWMADMSGKINALMIGIGGALPVLVGVKKRAPKWMQHAGLEWFYRLCQEPKRLFKRYALTNSIFMYLLSRELIRQKIFNK
jgi:N-acetylglucosaminyldiphosphoundecaprenol N-acetyl-beta-D-mannosaminyltransferase